jgi:hypothetical protein
MLLEHDAGHHDQELQQARLLMRQAPHEIDSRLAMQHAAMCNRDRLQARPSAVGTGRQSNENAEKD